MIAEEKLYSFVGKLPFLEASVIKERRYWTQKSKELDFKQLLDKTMKELEGNMLYFAPSLKAEYIDSLKFHMMSNAGIYIPTEELKRMLSEKNPDGTSSYLPKIDL